jgi:hypothetical protein
LIGGAHDQEKPTGTTEIANRPVAMESAAVERGRGGILVDAAPAIYVGQPP